MIFEEWIAYPDRHAFMPVADHASHGSRQGWWVSGAQGDEAWVRATGYAPGVPLVTVTED